MFLGLAFRWGRKEQKNHEAMPGIGAVLVDIASSSTEGGDQPGKGHAPQILPSLGMFGNTCDPSTWEAEAGGLEFEASLHTT